MAAAEDFSGSLHLIIGPMFSGKSMSLVNELLRFDVIGARVLYLNSAHDTRTTDAISTHHPMLSTKTSIASRKVHDLYEVYGECTGFDVIGIDEAQFFGRLRDFVLDMVEREGKRVIVAGLSGNFRRESMGELLSLIPYADRVEKLNSMCLDCSTHRRVKEAHFSWRVLDQSAERVVGAAAEYVAVCRSCYLRRMQSKSDDGTERAKITA